MIIRYFRVSILQKSNLEKFLSNAINEITKICWVQSMAKIMDCNTKFYRERDRKKLAREGIEKKIRSILKLYNKIE